MNGEVRVVEDVPQAYATLVAEAFLARRNSPFVLCTSGGSSGRAVLGAAAASTSIDWGKVALCFVDERCVAPDSADANQQNAREALGDAWARLAGVYPMSCEAGAEAYEAELRSLGPIDLCQLGMGPDGHTASLFPNSTALSAPPGRLVVPNVDPSGVNAHPRLTLTYEAISGARLVVITVTGDNKAAALAAIEAGADLPAARVRAPRLVWLIDAAVRNGG